MKNSCLLFLGLAMVASADAALVTINSILYVGTASEENSIPALTNESNLINGSGLSAPLTVGNIDSVTHLNAAFSGGNAWTTIAPGGGSSDFFASTSATVVFELLFDQAYALTNFYNWSYDFSEPNLNGNNFRTVVFEYGVGDFSSSTGSFNLAALSGNSGRSNTAIDITADRLRITVLDNYFGVSGFQGGDRVAAAEFAFLGTAVPEPSGAALGILGLLALFKRRR